MLAKFLFRRKDAMPMIRSLYWGMKTKSSAKLDNHALSHFHDVVYTREQIFCSVQMALVIRRLIFFFCNSQWDSLKQPVWLAMGLQQQTAVCENRPRRLVAPEKKAPNQASMKTRILFFQVLRAARSSVLRVLRRLLRCVAHPYHVTFTRGFKRDLCRQHARRRRRTARQRQSSTHRRAFADHAFTSRDKAAMRLDREDCRSRCAQISQ